MMQILLHNDESPIYPEIFYELIEVFVELTRNANAMSKQMKSLVEDQKFWACY
jgi:hypothetical protein